MAWAAVLAVAVLSSTVHAEEASAPPAIQGQILTRILAYDRNFAVKSKNEVVVLLLIKADNSDAANAVGQIGQVLKDIASVDSVPIRVERVTFSSAADLTAACRRTGANVLYVPPGLRPNVRDIANALVGTGVLSFAAVEDYVIDGITVGINIVAGKPKMSINLAQAKLQGLEFAAPVLRLARIY